MPKGDYAKLKADIEDGVVPIAHLLLEALSMAKLNGVAKGLVLFIWRRTYGWSEEGKRKHKDDRITLAEFATAVSSERTYVSTQLKLLVKAQVIFERSDPDNGRYKRYGMNTEIANWSSTVMDVDKLVEAVNSKLYVHSSRKVLQTDNGLVNTQPFAITQPLSNHTTQQLCKSTTVVVDNPLSDADSESSKESIERNKKIDSERGIPRAREDIQNDTMFQLLSAGNELYKPYGISQTTAYGMAEMLVAGDIPIEVGIEAIAVAKQLGRDEGFAKTKLRRWLQSGITEAVAAKEYESQNFGQRAGPTQNGGVTRGVNRASPEPDDELDRIQARWTGS